MIKVSKGKKGIEYEGSVRDIISDYENLIENALEDKELFDCFATALIMVHRMYDHVPYDEDEDDEKDNSENVGIDYEGLIEKTIESQNLFEQFVTAMTVVHNNYEHVPDISESNAEASEGDDNKPGEED